MQDSRRSFPGHMFIVFLSLLVASCAQDAAPQLPGEYDRLFTGTVESQAQLQYHLFLPDGYGTEPDQSWPLIMFLHGAGERGDDLEMVKIHGYDKIAAPRPGFPFILVSPLCPADSWWTLEIEALDALMEEVLELYKVDYDRVYLTGLSMGGQGAWYYALAHPERFAAIAPICGWTIPYLACRLIDIPTWAFHGEDDTTVPPGESRRMIAAMQRCGAEPRLTLYPGTGHNAWTPTYANDELFSWLLEQQRLGQRR